MSDPFNNMMISRTAPQVLMAGANMFAQNSANNQALQQQQQGREQNMLQFMMQQDAQSRQERQQERQFGMQSRREDRAFAAQREESAFARLNHSLDRQLKVAEMENNQRQQAFENTLKAQMFDVQLKGQTAQLKEIEDRQAFQAMQGSMTQLEVALSGKGPGGFREMPEAMRALIADNSAAVAWASVNAPEWNSNIQQRIRLAEEMSTKIPVFATGDSETGYTFFTEGQMNETLLNLDLSKEGAVDPDDLQALGYKFHTLWNNTDSGERDLMVSEWAEVNGENFADMEEATRARHFLRIKAEELGRGGANPHLDNLAAGLESGAGAVRFEELFKAGLTNPVTDKEKLLLVQNNYRAHYEEQARVIAAATQMGGNYMVDEAFRGAREHARRQLQVVNSRTMYGDGASPDSEWVAAGGISDFNSVNKHIQSQIVLHDEHTQLTGSDVWSFVKDFSGWSGASRAARLTFAGRASDVGAGDWVDAVLMPITLIPGVGLVKRVGVGAVKWGVARAAGAVGAKSPAWTAGRQAVRQAAQQKARTDLATAQGRLATAELNLSTARKPGAVKKATTALEEAKSAWDSASAAVASANAISTGGSNLAGGTALAVLGTHQVVAGQEQDFRQKKNLDSYGARGSGVRFNALNRAADDVNDALTPLKALKERARPEDINTLVEALRNYSQVAGGYYGQGQMPPQHIQEKLLSLRAILPRIVVDEIQYRYGLGTGAFEAQGQYSSNADIMRAAGGMQQQQQLQAPQAGGGVFNSPAFVE